jgi:Phosphopantetheinyl transferase
MGHLSAAEMERYVSIGNSRRRLKWLAGRLAAKYVFLSRFELGQRQSSSKPQLLRLSRHKLSNYSSWMYQKVEVLPKKDANPTLIWCDEPQSESISLSHTDDVSCACLSFAGPIGIDIENSVPRASSFYRRTFTAAEQSWARHASGKDRFSTEWLFTLLWTLKESALKLQTANQTVWDLPRIEILGLPKLENFSLSRKDRTLATDFLTFPAGVKAPYRTRQVQVAVTGSRNLILTVMNT